MVHKNKLLGRNPFESMGRRPKKIKKPRSRRKSKESEVQKPKRRRVKGIQVSDQQIEYIFGLMTPVKGERRAVYQCGWCGKPFGRRFVPRGIGQGKTVTPCSCYCTGKPPLHTLEERSP